ncbi:MAG: cytochrome c3 family protein [Bacteroidota bacterium]
MKRIIFVFIALMTVAAIVFAMQSTPEIKKTVVAPLVETTVQTKKIKSTPENSGTWKDHSKQAINCKTCHVCDYPTKKDPCLIPCPKSEMISVYHSPSEGPEIVIMDKMMNKYGGVVFSHKLHAGMSEMSDGCSGCHHYNTTGPILACKKCHSTERKREDVSLPDLQGAYHRQCMTCHRQWSHTTGCDNTCHVPKKEESSDRRNAILAKLTGKTHPAQPKPEKMVYETNYEHGKIVTFFHDEHTKLFGKGCISCHKQENCTKCHDKGHTQDSYAKHWSGPVKTKKTLEEHHKPCNTCHEKDNCIKCHQNKEMKPFDHYVSTGWALKSYHVKLNCTKCHGNQQPRKMGTDCFICHKEWKTKGFNHQQVSLALDEAHKELECETCHENKNFNRTPICSGCHDDKSYPKHLPGKFIKRKGKK